MNEQVFSDYFKPTKNYGLNSSTFSNQTLAIINENKKSNNINDYSTLPAVLTDDMQLARS